MIAPDSHAVASCRGDATGDTGGAGVQLGPRLACYLQTVGSRVRDVHAAARLTIRDILRVPHGAAIQSQWRVHWISNL